MNGIIETSSGDLLRWGESTFTPGAGESAASTPLPAAPKRKFQRDETQMHRWNSGTSSYDLVAQPTKPGINIDRTISGGTITIPTTKRHFFFITVDTESAASTDNLDAILGGDIGAIVVLRIKAATRDVIVRDDQAVGADKFELNGDFTLDDIKDKIMLIRRNATVWDEISRSPN